MQVVGDEPSHFRERRPGATGGKGIEGGRSAPPRQKLNVRTLSMLAPDIQSVRSQLFP